MLNQQWHLINQEMKDVELNVTSLWSRGVTGSGVRIGIIDDGLDMDSDDLAENFVSHSVYKAASQA
jgi:kexin